MENKNNNKKRIAKNLGMGFLAASLAFGTPTVAGAQSAADIQREAAARRARDMEAEAQITQFVNDNCARVGCRSRLCFADAMFAYEDMFHELAGDEMHTASHIEFMGREAYMRQEARWRAEAHRNALSWYFRRHPELREREVER